MARLPTPGGDDGAWGNVLNDFLAQSHNSDGTLKPIDPAKISGTALTAAQLGAASGVASLDSGSKLTSSQLPTVGGRGTGYTVAPSNAPAAMQKGADYICTGTNDDVIINQAIAALPFNGGLVKLLPGDFYLGTSATSFINATNQSGGITIEGSGRRQGAIVHVPAGSAAPCAVKSAVWSNGSGTVRNLYVSFVNPSGISTHGIWMQCGEAQVYNCAVSGAAGHGIILDGAPASAGASPSVKTYSGHIDGCEIYQAGSGVAGDGFVVTTLSENNVISNCFVDGGSGSASATLTSALTSGNSYTTLTVSPLTNAITSGDSVVIGTASTYPSTRQLVTASATANKGATSISVTSFTANFTYPASPNTYVCDNTKMVTRNGFSIAATTHVDDCHPYFCYESGINVHQSAVFIMGGEYENNGWTNMMILGSLIAQACPIQVIGVNTYGNPAYCSIYAFGCLSAVFAGNYIDGGLAANGIYVQNCQRSVIANNTVSNATSPIGGVCVALSAGSCTGCTFTGNTVVNNFTPSGSYYGLSLFACTSCTVVGNNVSLTAGTNYSFGGGTTAKTSSNTGYNPTGTQSVTVPSSGVATGAAVFDQVFYITASTGTTTVAISGGPTITLTASVLNTVRVPAGTTLTATYTNAPTWVVEGE